MRSDHAHFRSLNAAILKMQSEDFQTMERSQETKRAERSGRSTGGESARQERRSPKVFGKGGKVVAKSSSAFFKKNPRKRLETSSSYYDSKTGAMDEDYQSPERARQTYNTGQEGSKQDTDEKASKKVYGKDGKVVHASLANMRRSLNKKNKAVAESVESAEYTELLESVLLALCEELELDPNELVEDYQTPERAATTRRAVEQAKAMHEYERTSPHTYGKGGRLVKKAKTKRALSAGQKTNAFLKSLYK